ncbi:hypothetical protein DPMN_003207 [Dreissena polymorpha]|uniref:Uncharacterized protein n=1 Tax=Dreissena polymorpha TaxID=45954 RepID=A0A9D4ML45_DREPO|nr:hypothetical protein DPMN_003207 [Dreissena polymorpha]
MGKIVPPLGRHIFSTHRIHVSGAIIIKLTFNVLTKFHKDCTKAYKKNCLVPLGAIFQRMFDIFKFSWGSNRTNDQNIVRKFHDDRFAHLRGCSITRKTAPPWRPYIYKTNHFTKFHDDWAKNVISRKIAPPARQPCYSTDRNNFLTQLSYQGNKCSDQFHENWAVNVPSKVEKCPAHWRPCFSPIWTIFELVRDINKTNVLSNFHHDWAKNVASIEKTAPPTGGHVFQRTRTTFDLNQHMIKTNILTNFQLHRDIIGTKLLTKFHEDRKRNVPSRVFTNKSIRKTATSPWQPFLTKFHEDLTKNVTFRVETAPLPGGHIFSPIWTIFELVQDINKTNVLFKFYNDWAKIMTSRVFTRKTAPPTGSHVFQRTGTNFELNQHIIMTNILTNFELDLDFIGTKLLTKFHEDRTRNVASRVFTNKCGQTKEGQRPVTKAHLSNQVS